MAGVECLKGKKASQLRGGTGLYQGDSMDLFGEQSAGLSTQCHARYRLGRQQVGIKGADRRSRVL